MPHEVRAGVPRPRDRMAEFYMAEHPDVLACQGRPARDILQSEYRREAVIVRHETEGRHRR